MKTFTEKQVAQLLIDIEQCEATDLGELPWLIEGFVKRGKISRIYRKLGGKHYESKRTSTTEVS